MLSCDNGQIVQKLRDSKQLYKYKVNDDILKVADGSKLRFFPGDKGRILMLAGTKAFAITSTDEENSELAFIGDFDDVM